MFKLNPFVFINSKTLLLVILLSFPHTSGDIKEGKKKFNTECKEVISEELTVHMKALSLSW